MSGSKLTPTAITHLKLEELSKDFLKMSAEFSTVKNEVHDIKNLLHSNPAVNQKGAIETLHDMNKRVFGLEEREKIGVAKKSLLVAVAMTVGGGLVTLIKWFFIK